MRILHVSDAHCEPRGVAEVLRRESFDTVLYTGDFECIDVAELLLDQSPEVYATTGELDNPAVYRLLRARGSLLDGALGALDEYVVAGVGGLEAINNIRSLRSKLSEREADVIASHHPPAGILDSGSTRVHGGLVELRILAERVKPLLHAFGHVHERPGVARVGETVFVNSGSISLGFYALIEMRESVVKAEVRRL